MANFGLASTSALKKYRVAVPFPIVSRAFHGFFAIRRRSPSPLAGRLPCPVVPSGIRSPVGSPSVSFRFPTCAGRNSSPWSSCPIRSGRQLFPLPRPIRQAVPFHPGRSSFLQLPPSVCPAGSGRPSCPILQRVPWDPSSCPGVGTVPPPHPVGALRFPILIKNSAEKKKAFRYAFVFMRFPIRAGLPVPPWSSISSGVGRVPFSKFAPFLTSVGLPPVVICPAVGLPNFGRRFVLWQAVRLLSQTAPCLPVALPPVPFNSLRSAAVVPPFVPRLSPLADPGRCPFLQIVPAGSAQF